MRHERTIGSKGQGLWGMKGEQLPAYIQHVYNDMVEGGAPTGSMTYRRAVGIVENWAEGHDGKGNKVKADTQAKAAAAIAEWNALRAKRHAMSAKGKIKEAILEADAEDRSDKGSDESSEMPSVYCPKDQKKVKPTSEKKCPSCGTDLSKAVAMARKVKETVLAVLESGMSMTQRKNLNKSDFAIPEKAPGSGSYPIHDLAHARNALARCSGKPEEKRVKAAVYRRYPQLKNDRVKEAVLEAFDENLHPRDRRGEWRGKGVASEGRRIGLKVGEELDTAQERLLSGQHTMAGDVLSFAAKHLPDDHPARPRVEQAADAARAGQINKASYHLLGAKAELRKKPVAPYKGRGIS